MQDKPEISVIICTRNPRGNYLQSVLNALDMQTLSKDGWELVVIDNGSDVPLDSRIDLAWHPNGRIVSEPMAGLTSARLRGFRETNADLIVMVDDDNELAPDYLGACLDIASKWPILGTWGGSIEPVFETEPEDWTRRYWSWLAIRPLDKDLWSNLPDEAKSHPCGAGMCLRRIVATTYSNTVVRDPLRMRLDRSGESLWGGGDSDLAFTACELGLGNGLFKALNLRHHMPSFRLTEQYLLRLVEDLTCSYHLVKHAWGHPPMAPSRSERIFRWYCHLRIPARERRFEDARLRGLHEAVRIVNALSK